MLKCSRCRHIFPAEPTQRAPAPPAPPPEPPRARPPERRDLVFDEPTWEEENDDTLEALPDDEDDYSLGTDGRGATAADDRRRAGPSLVSPEKGPRAAPSTSKVLGRPTTRRAEAPSLTFDDDDLGREMDAEPTLPLRAALRPAPPAPEEDDDEVDEEEEADEREIDESGDDEEGEMRRRSGWAFPLMLFFSVVVGGYFFLARELINDRVFAEDFIARLPLVGGSLAADRWLFRKVALNDVQGTFVDVRQGKEVFVISGTALNTASRPLRDIRIEGKLLDREGRALQEQTVAVGGMDARRLLRGLSLREVEMLAKVEPARNFLLAPGQRSTFAIVFTSPPADTAEVAARVVSAQR